MVYRPKYRDPKTGETKESKIWWYKFSFGGELIRESTKQRNQRIAEQMESAKRTQLAKGLVGIHEKKLAPTFKEFAPRFREAIKVRCAAKPRTVAFYEEKLERLLEYEPLATARLDRIDEALIEGFVQERIRRFAPATVNRALATLRRALRLAHEWKLLDRVPRIRLLPGERVREFVLTPEQEKLYLAASTQPLHDVALLILDTGLRSGEALNLQWPDAHLDPVTGAKYGYLRIREGKSRNAKRNVSITGRVRDMLASRKATAESLWVFPGYPEGAAPGSAPFRGTSLNHQHQKVRTLLKLPSDFVVHSLRHTMLTRLGEAGVDAFTIMRIAGHSSIMVSQRYVHPSSEAMERAFEKLEALTNGAKVETPQVAEGGQSIGKVDEEAIPAPASIVLN